MSVRDRALCLRALMFALALLLGLPAAHAVPLYTVREGRTCDNCHSLPNDWVDPPEMYRRKCTLSCSGCHVDPGGGGLRTVSGVYFGRSTLPMWMATDRPWADKKAHGEYRPELTTSGSQPLSDAGSQPLSEATGAGSQPLSEATGAGSQPLAAVPDAPKPTGGLAFGHPLDGGGAEMAFLDGRYGDLNADPLLRLGADLRLGFWTQGGKLFPMQGDAYAAVHPVEHLMLSTAVGIRGRIRGPGADDPDGQSRFGVRDLWLMTNEWPLNAYARAGRFLPQFGWRLDDHTAYTRRPFGLSQEDPANRVIGGEVGFNANYPYVNVAAWVPGTTYRGVTFLLPRFSLPATASITTFRLITPMWKLLFQIVDNPMNDAKLSVRRCCLSHMEPESSMTNSTSTSWPDTCLNVSVWCVS